MDKPVRETLPHKPQARLAIHHSTGLTACIPAPRLYCACAGSGKTHTLTGTAADPGIIARAVGDLFKMMEARPATDFLVKVR